MEIQEKSTSLLKFVEKDDVDGAKRLLARVLNRKSVVAKKGNSNAPLFVAAMRGNLDMVEFLVTECHADLEETGRYSFKSKNLDSYYLVTPLWCAAASDKLDVVDLLIDLGADINAASDTGSTPVLEACYMNADVVKCLVEHGADVNKPDNDGETCLMIAAQWSKEFCQIIIDNGADVKAQDSSGNSALHFAITLCDNDEDREDIVQLLIDRGSDPYMINKDGEDAFLSAILTGNESILEKLMLRFKPPVRRRIELYEMLGAYYVRFIHDNIHDLDEVFSCWKEAIEMRRMNSYFDVETLQTNPVSIFFPEVRSVEELETLCQNRDFVYMYALMIYERILGPDSSRMHDAMMDRGSRYFDDGEFRLCIHIFKYAFQVQTARVEQQTSLYLPVRYIRPLTYLCSSFYEAYRESQQHNNNDNFGVDFEGVFEVLLMATSHMNNATEAVNSQKFQNGMTLQLIFLKAILLLIKIIIKLDKNEIQKFSFNKLVYRLVRCQPKTETGQTLLHLSVKECTSEIDEDLFSQFPSIAVVELLLECGANVNAVDSEHNTALHLCSQAIQNLEMQHHHDLINRIAVLLLKNEAHLDMINISGDRAAKGLTTCLKEINIQDVDSLKCLVARAVVKNMIPYVGSIPTLLESFVQMHGICASNGNSPA